MEDGTIGALVAKLSAFPPSWDVRMAGESPPRLTVFSVDSLDGTVYLGDATERKDDDGND